MHFISLRSTAALGGAVLALGGMPTLASAEGGNVPSITIVTPTSGTTVGGTTQPVTIKAPAGTTQVYVICDYVVDNAPFAPSTWSPEASDGTMTGTVDLSHCTNGANGLAVYTSGTGDEASTHMAITMANPGALHGDAALTSTTFSPDGDHVLDTVLVHGGYVQADRIIVRVRDAHGRLVDTVTAQTWLETFGRRYYEATWDGRTSKGRPARQGTYTLQVVASTKAGGAGPVTTATARLVRHHKGYTAIKPTDQVVTFAPSEGRMYFQGWPGAGTTAVCRKADGTIVSSGSIGTNMYSGWAPMSNLPGGTDCTVSVTTASGIRTDLPRSGS